jgi:UPF0176 protein
MRLGGGWYIAVMTTNAQHPTPTFQVLLYYWFAPLDHPEEIAQEQRDLCARLDLRGRILVSPEGLNGTVSGTVGSCEAYCEAMRNHPIFHPMVFKIDPSDGHVFRKMFVRLKEELVTFRAPNAPKPWERTGTHLSPAAFRAMLERDDVIVLDGRTDYEFDVGHFRKAIRPEVASFREFPDWIRANLADAKDRPILTYCTGGIRCEKLTGWMLEEGFTNVYQLDGGIVSYGKDPDVRGELWDGTCYVFDERITVPINSVNPVVVGRCIHCDGPTDIYVDCANLECHSQHLACPECIVRMEHSCSESCRTAPRRETVDLSRYQSHNVTEQPS